MLSLTSVSKRFGDLTALDAVSLEVSAGEFFGLMGLNGAGKSTTMALIAGLLPADSGEIALEGEALGQRSFQARLRMGIVPQEPRLQEDLTAEETLFLFGELHGFRGPHLRDRVDQVLDTVRIQDRRRHKVAVLPGGVRRRLALGAALLHGPKLLLCDEPVLGLDEASRDAIFDCLRKLNTGGLTILYATRTMEEASLLCSRIGVLDHGRLLAAGSEQLSR